MTFRREIQGLRALAVIAVVLDHLELPAFAGGFIGVDMFFVISGYLITGLLVEEHAASRHIDLVAFYGRRARRILPALIVTVLLTVGFGFLVLSQGRFEALLDSAIAALLSGSNILFWSEVGYFDVEAASKPLLHTWSLGVEEQFYLLWPLFVRWLLRSRSSRVGGFMLGVSLVSWLLYLVFASGWLSTDANAEEGVQAWLADGAATAFYLTPCRIFELGIGALLAWRHQRERERASSLPGARADLWSAIALLGLLGIVLGVAEHTLWSPLTVALLTACLLHAAPQATRVGRMLGARPMLAIGGASYSLYLVHWPLVVYFRLFGAEPVGASLAALVAAMCVAAWLLHRLVEQPLRHAALLNPTSGRQRRRALWALPLAALIGIGLLLPLYAVEGRIPGRREPSSTRKWRRMQEKKFCKGSIEGFPSALFTCVIDRDADQTLVLWGDSHAKHLVAGFSKAFRKWNVAIAYQTTCAPQNGYRGWLVAEGRKQRSPQCLARNKAMLEWSRGYRGKAVVFLSNQPIATPEAIAPINNALVTQLRADGHTAYALGDFIGPAVQLASCRSVPDWLISDAMLIGLCRPDRDAVAAQLRYGRELAARSKHFISVQDAQCPNDACSFVDDHGRLTHHDTHHLSISGSIYEVRRVRERIQAAIRHDARRAAREHSRPTETTQTPVAP